MSDGKYPVVVMWNYGNQCNMDCIHCYSRTDSKSCRATLTLSDAKYIAQEIILSKAIHVHFGGGEPLMRDDLEYISSTLAEKEINLSLSTNGYFLDENKAKMLKKVAFDRVSLSFYGIKSETHDRFTRCPGAFKKLMLACSNVIRTGLRTRIVYSLNARTEQEATNILELATEQGVDCVQFVPIKIIGNASDNLEVLQLAPEKWRELYDKLFEKSKDYPDLKVDYGYSNNPLVAGYIEKTILPCSCGRYSVVIKSNGDVTPCSFISTVIGNVFERPLLDIWQNSPALQAIRKGTQNPCML